MPCGNRSFVPALKKKRELMRRLKRLLKSLRRSDTSVLDEHDEDCCESDRC